MQFNRTFRWKVTGEMFIHYASERNDTNPSCSASGGGLDDHSSSLGAASSVSSTYSAT